MSARTPAEPAAKQCEANERVAIPGSDTPAYAVWWPQMGGHHGRAVITAGECPEVWVWHDGSFPFHGHHDTPGRSPIHLHLCDADQWIELFEQQKVWAAEWRGDGDEYSPQAQPTAADLIRAGVDLTPYAESPERESHTPLAAELGWEPEDPLLVELANARLDRQEAIEDRKRRADASHEDLLQAAMKSALRGEGAADTPVPVVVTVPEGVTAEQAMEWIRGCEQLGLIEPSPAGRLFLPPGVL